jgi:hypothetical protein
MTLASTDADSNFVVRLEEELSRLEQLRQCVLESLAARLQGPRQRYYLRVQLLELNRSITGIRGVLSLPALASPPRFREERPASPSSGIRRKLGGRRPRRRSDGGDQHLAPR